jgi:hypothetical protein
MPTHIGKATTEIIPEPEPQSEDEMEDSRWENLEKVRKIMTRIKCIKRRTRSEGFDD